MSTVAITPGSAMTPVDVPFGPTELQVRIDQNLCSGDGIYTDHAPEAFAIMEDGIAYYREGDIIFNDPGGATELARVPPSVEKDVDDAAAKCP